MKQRLLSLLLALALLLSLLPAAAQTVRAEELEERPAAANQTETKAQKAEARREHSRGELTRGIEDAAELRLDEPYEVVITEPGETVWLRFTPQETGSYVLSAADGADNYCMLYDSEYNELSSDDDGGDALNFRLKYKLEAGACYYYEIFYLDDEETGSFPVTLTVYDPVRSGACGDELSWSFDLDTGVLTIEGQGDMWSFWPQRGDGYVSSDAVPWKEFLDQITELRLPEGLSSIGDVAFQGCSGLESVTIPGTVRRIGQFAFSGCGALQSIVIPEGVTTIGARAFDFCGSLTEVELAASVSSVEELAFRECYNLETISFLNPACDIADDCLADARSVIVCGFPESTAERFAAEHGLLFLPVGATELTGVCGDELSWRFDLETNVLTVEGEGAMWDMWDSADFRGDGYYSGNAQPWKAISHRVTGLLLPEGLSSIGDVAFNGFWSLESVVIPETVDSIGVLAFGACELLSELVIPEGVNTIRERAFTFCDSLTDVELPESVTYVGPEAFGACFNLEKIIFRNPLCDIAGDCLVDCENVRVYGYDYSTAEIFATQNGLPFVSLGSAGPIELEGVCGDALNWSFRTDSGLLRISGSGPMYDYDTIYNEDTEDLNWTTPWYVFRSLIRQVELPEGLSAIGCGAFAHCDSLQELTLPRGLESVGDYAFSDCSGLSELTLPQGLESVGSYTFSDCIALSEINLPDSVASIGDSAFADCDSLTRLRLPDGLVFLGDFVFSSCDSLQELTLSGAVESFGQSVFEGCRSLRSVELAASFCLDYEAYPIPKLFYDLIDLMTVENGEFCRALERFHADEANSMFSTDAEGTLYTKDGKQLLAYPTGKTGGFTVPAGVTEIGRYAFFNCDGLKEIRFSAGLTRIDEYAFSFCDALTELSLPDALRSIDDGAFSRCEALQRVGFGTGLREIGTAAFDSCYALEELSLPAGLELLGNFAFSGCAGLRSVRIGEGLETVGASAFSNCVSLEELRLPQSLTAIDDCAFFGCSSLRSVKLPAVQSLGANVFYDCQSLRELIFRDPDCMVETVNYQKSVEYTNDTGEDLEEPYVFEDQTTYWESLGIPGQAQVFGLHDPAKENAGMMKKNVVEEPDNSSWEGWYYLENYAALCDYSFCALGSFSDVAENSYYELPVAWAVAMGVTSGAGEGVFAPKKTCTREQIVTFLWKALGSPEPEASESSFSDVKPGKYYFKPVLWAVENGVTGGMGDGKFGVGRPCTREQAVSFLWKALGAPEPEGTESPFTDVKPGKYYYKPVLWAVENGVTGGVGDGRFGVGSSCTRAQIVTFLYKAFQ